MSSKLGLAGGIPERRVRPIWDAVESRQFKTALKLSAALLSKYPNSPYAIALKALILERMGKPNDAMTVCIEAKELLCSMDLATSCYEHACGKFPSKEILMGLFDCYVREYSFVKQQQTAIKLYKIAAEERFLLWAICSIQLQVLCSSGAEKLLSFAEALLKKHIASYSLHEPEVFTTAVVMYISILEQQGKYIDALEILSGDLGSVIGIEADKLRMQTFYCFISQIPRALLTHKNSSSKSKSEKALLQKLIPQKLLSNPLLPHHALLPHSAVASSVPRLPPVAAACVIPKALRKQRLTSTLRRNCIPPRSDSEASRSSFLQALPRRDLGCLLRQAHPSSLSRPSFRFKRNA
ncbi:hypothetical protein KSP40_PGU021957 [Platanthera guangdongensis]|uniref:Uncharacterized protein n=1 Tax=Platanthera guangdongensis TaxID=2320717 RepID=A0ABR2N3G6_9ASPA